MKNSITAKFFLIIVFLFLLNINNSTVIFAQGPIIEVVELEQLNLRNMQPEIMYSQYALLTLGYLPAALNYYLTIGIERPGNGTFSMVIQNMLLPSAEYMAEFQYLSMRISLLQLGVTNGVQLPPGTFLRVYIHMDSSPMLFPSSLNFYREFNPLPTYGDDDSEGIDSPVPSEEPMITQNTPGEDFTAVSKLNYRGCRVPNVDLDDSAYPDNETYAGDKNACGPASAANSMAWLLDVYKSDLHLEMSVRDILTELSGYMKRERNSGVTLNQFIQGKLDFIKAKKLPIKVKFQSADTTGNIFSSDGSTYAENKNGTNKYPTWDWIKAELDSGEDVEAHYYWWDGEKWRGHAVVLTGYDETSGGKKTLKYKHDRKQGASGGLQQEPANILVDDYGRLVFYNNGHRKYIRHVVSESPGDPYTPVEMSYFSAKIISNKVELVWKTITETNNRGFGIEKSTDKISFNTIGFVNGKGTSSNPQIYNYTDINISGSKVFYYRLKQVDFDGTFEYSQSIEVRNNLPGEYNLLQNFPNPFNPTTTINFSLPVKSFVTLKVYNAIGNEIAVLVNEEKPAGFHEVVFNAFGISNGVYYYRLQTGDYSVIKKMILLK
ncbi:MAG: T9SS C-terminal target domain-containing protein [Ignavibacteriales bacterium]|nr:MAG: T9SS C-terminal target domain-containing protein [Ignavibacteriales bacterium]